MEGTPFEVVATVPVGGDPSEIAAGSGGTVYVINSGTDNVTEVSTVTDKVTATLRVGSSPDDLAFDSATDELFVANADSTNVTVFEDDLELASVPVRPGPAGVAYDPTNGEVYVAETGYVSVICVSSEDPCYPGVGVPPEVVASIALVGWDYHIPTAAGMIYDSADDNLYVACTSNGIGQVDVIDASSDSVTAAPYVGRLPSALAYDPVSQEVVVANSGSNNLTVLSTATSAVVGTVPLTAQPTGISYDPAANAMLVTDADASVNVVSVEQGKVIATVPVGYAPKGVLYDSGVVFVADSGEDTVSVLSESASVHTSSIDVSSDPWGAAYDPSTDQVFVTNIGNAPDYLTVISDSDNQVVTTIPVGDSPKGVAYDSGRSEMFVANSADGTVSVVLVANDSVVATVPVRAVPYGVAYDPTVGEVFVSNEYSFDVSVINDTTDRVVGTVPVGANPEGLAVDASAGEVFAVNDESQNVSVISVTTNRVVASIPVGPNPEDAAFDPATQTLYVSNFGSNNLSVISVASRTAVASVAVGSGPTGVAYDPETGEIVVADESSDNASFVWDLENKVIQSVPVGSSPLGVAFDSGQNSVFVANVLSSNVTVVALPRPLLSLVFVEQGVPAGVTWTVTLTGAGTLSSSATTIAFLEPAGSYSFTVGGVVGYVSNVTAGQVVLADAERTVLLGFTRPTYPVTFTESGLPASTGWSVTVIGDPTSETTGPTVVLQLMTGVYAYRAVSADPAYSAEGARVASIVVDGAPLAQPVLFVRSATNITFAETGLLPLGTTWWVDVNGSLESSTVGTMGFREPVGSEPYTVDPVDGYAPSPASDILHVGSSTLVISVVFTSTSTLAVDLSLTPDTVGEPQPGPLTVAFSASGSGGAPPYAYSWDLGDGTTGTGPSLSHTYNAPGTYLASVKVTDGAGSVRWASEPVEVGTSGDMTSWIPAVNAYGFLNLGSVWNAGGNCYGMSSTAALYYDHYTLGIASAPYLPDDPSFYPNALPYISAAAPPLTNSKGEWDNFDNVTLAIYLHQVSAINYFSLPLNNTLTESVVLNSLQDHGAPVVVGLGPRNLHAVVIYGAQLFSNGSAEFAISDPNTGNASRTTNAWFVPPDTFHYRAGYQWSEFEAMAIGAYWAGGPISGSVDPWAVNTLTGGWQLVLSSNPVKISSNGTDSFSDANGGDSESFDQGIAGSAGIEEASGHGEFGQAYLVPPGDPAVSIDPPSSSTLTLAFGDNQSGTRSIEEEALNVSSSAPYDVQRTPQGFAMKSSGEPMTLNLTVLYETDTGWDQLNASGLDISGGESAWLNVTNWKGLNSSSTPSVLLTLGGSAGGPRTTYDLANGQVGLGAPLGPPHPSRSSTLLGLPVLEGYLLVGGAAVLLGAVPVALIYRGRRRRPPSAAAASPR